MVTLGEWAEGKGLALELRVRVGFCLWVYWFPFHSFYSVYAATRGSEFHGTGHIRPGEASGRI